MTDEPINEVEALKNVFYQFFSDKRSQLGSEQEQLVSLEKHDFYFNPFSFATVETAFKPKAFALSQEVLIEIQEESLGQDHTDQNILSNVVGLR